MREEKESKHSWMMQKHVVVVQCPGCHFVAEAKNKICARSATAIFYSSLENVTVVVLPPSLHSQKRNILWLVSILLILQFEIFAPRQQATNHFLVLHSSDQSKTVEFVKSMEFRWDGCSGGKFDEPQHCVLGLSICDFAGSNLSNRNSCIMQSRKNGKWIVSKFSLRLPLSWKKWRKHRIQSFSYSDNDPLIDTFQR